MWPVTEFITDNNKTLPVIVKPLNAEN